MTEKTPDSPAATQVATAESSATDTAATQVSETDDGSSPNAEATQVKPQTGRELPDYQTFKGWWFFIALVFLAAAAVVCVLVGRGTTFSLAHREAAAWGGLLVVAALAVCAQVILLWYQYQMTRSGGGQSASTVGFRRRGLKAAVIGQDGRASTSKTQVVLWTAGVTWALVDLLLLARAYPGGNLFSGAVTTNWRPEYLVLLGLPVAAATTAKAAVTSSNQGRGPLTPEKAQAVASSRNRMYVRESVPNGVWGFVTGLAELLTADDGTVAWADLQYVIFTLITLVYFVTQVLAQPRNGLPPVPAALLTLMGISATGYAANKIVNTMGSPV